MDDFAASQAMWPLLFLLVSGAGKLLEARRPPVRESVLTASLGRWLTPRTSIILVASGEIGLVVLLAANVALPWSRLATATFLITAAVIAAWGLRRHPELDCGCAGGLGPGPVSRKTVSRAAFLAMLALISALTAEPLGAGLDQPAALAALALEGVVLAWLSPDLTSQLRTATERRGLDRGCTDPVPLATAMAILSDTKLWRSARHHLVSETPGEGWREGCAWIACFDATYEGRNATAVAAIHLGTRSGRHAIAFVDEQAHRVLARATQACCGGGLFQLLPARVEYSLARPSSVTAPGQRAPDRMARLTAS